MGEPTPREVRLYGEAAERIYLYLEEKPRPFARGFWMVVPNPAGEVGELIAIDRDRFDWDAGTPLIRAGMDQIKTAVDTYDPGRQTVVVITDPHPGGNGVSYAKLRLVWL